MSPERRGLPKRIKKLPPKERMKALRLEFQGGGASSIGNTSITEVVSVTDTKRRELREISERLKMDTLDLTERITLSFKELWLKSHPYIREISESTRREQLQELLKTWKERFPETSKWFFEEQLPDGRTRAFHARQEVAPDQPKPFRQIRS